MMSIDATVHIVYLNTVSLIVAKAAIGLSRRLYPGYTSCKINTFKLGWTMHHKLEAEQTMVG